MFFRTPESFLDHQQGIEDFVLPEVSANFGLPPVYITFCQGSVIGDQPSSRNLGQSISTHWTVTMVYGRQCSLNIFSTIQNVRNIFLDTSANFVFFCITFFKLMYHSNELLRKVRNITSSMKYK